MVIENMCPVCGYEMEDPPRDYNICPSCGTEFGLHDVYASLQDLRAAWLQAGPKWWSPTDPVPQDWKPWDQVARVLPKESQAVGIQKVYMGTVNISWYGTSTSTIERSSSSTRSEPLPLIGPSSTRHGVHVT